MATPETKPAVFTFDSAKFIEQVRALKEAQLEHAGKKNHNPFLYINEKIIPLEERYLGGERSKELYDTLFALKLGEAPVINANKVVDPNDKAISVEPKAPAPQPQGLKLR